MSQTIQTIHNWTARELIDFCHNDDVTEEIHVEAIVERLVEIAEHNEKRYDEDKRLEKRDA